MNAKDRIIAGINAMSVFKLMVTAAQCGASIAELNVKDEAGEIAALRQSLIDQQCAQLDEVTMLGQAVLGSIDQNSQFGVDLPSWLPPVSKRSA